MIRPPAAIEVARTILESAAPDIVTDTMVELAASLIQNAVATDEILASRERDVDLAPEATS